MATLKADIKINAEKLLKNLQQIVGDFDKIKKVLSELAGSEIDIETEVDSTQLEEIQSEIDSIDGAEITGDLDIDSSDLENIESEINSIDGTSVEAEVFVDSNIGEVSAEIEGLDGTSVVVNAQVQTSTSGTGGAKEASLGGAVAGDKASFGEIAGIAHGAQELFGQAIPKLAVFGALTGVAIAGLKSFTDASNIQENAERNLALAMQQRNEYTEEGFQKTLDFASGLQKVTTFGDEAILELITLSKALGFVGDDSEQATLTALGLATQFEQLGLKPEQALRALSLAQQGNFAQLERSIPALRGVTDETEAWVIINEAAQSGLIKAEEFAKTTEGQLIQLSNSWGDVQEQIGAVVKTLLAELIPLINPIINIISTLVPLFQQIIQPIIAIIQNSLTPLIERLGVIVSELISMLVPIFSEILTAAQPLIDVLFLLIFDLLALIMPILQPFINTLYRILVPTIQLLASILTILVEIIRDLLEPVLQIIIEIFNEIVDIVNEVINEIFGTSDAFIDLKDIAGPLLIGIKDGIERIFNAILPVIRLIKDIWVGAIRIVVKIFQFFFSFLTRAWAGLQKDIEEFQEELAFIKKIVETIQAVFLAFFNEVKRQFDEFIKGIRSILEWMGLIKETTDEANKSLGNSVEITKQFAENTEKASDQLEGLGQNTVIVEEQTAEIAENTGQIAENTGQTAKNVKETKSDLLEQLVNLRLIGQTNDKLLNRIVDITREERERARVLEQINKQVDLILSGFRVIEPINISFETDLTEPINISFETDLTELRQPRQNIASIQVELDKQTAIEAENELINSVKNTADIVGNMLNNSFIIDDRLQQQRLDALQTETDFLNKQLEQRLISQVEYDQRIRQIEQNRTAVLQDNYAKTTQQAVIQLEHAFTKLEVDSKGNVQQVGRSLDELLENSDRIFHAVSDLAISNFALLGEQGAIELTSFTGIIESLAELGKSIGKDLATSLVNSYIPSIVALVMSVVPPPFGQIVAGIAVAFIKGLLNTALGAEKGVVGITKNYNTKAGKTDTIPILINKDESIINATDTKKNRELLEHINKGGSELAYFERKFSNDEQFRQSILKEISVKDILDSDLAEKALNGLLNMQLQSDIIANITVDNNNLKRYNNYEVVSRETSIEIDMPNEMNIKNQFSPMRIKGDDLVAINKQQLNKIKLRRR